VADTGNRRIQRFSSAGAFELTWGKAVNLSTGGNLCTAASGDTCQRASTGALGGEMNSPYGVAADAAGNLYLAEIGNDRIQKFADPPVTPPPPLGGGGAPPAATPTGQRFAALKKCKRKRRAARAKCRKKANKLPL